MSKVAHYLQEHLVGEVMTSTDARSYFAHDASIFQIAPSLVVYPRNENDVRKTARFAWQLAERGRIIPITARGSGTDQTGAAIGSGIMLVFPAHMNRILELDTKNFTVVVEPGINFGKLQQTLQTHGRFLPSYPASLEYSTVGGAIANNASGEKSFKYGPMSSHVQSLRVVLANGEVIETGPLNKRELSKKLGLSSFEGEVYRQMDTLLEENRDVVESMHLNVTKNNTGYNLSGVKSKDSFDLTPLILGSQGTLGIISEAVLETEANITKTTLIAAHFDSHKKLQQAILDLREFKDLPISVELVDGQLLAQVNKLNPNQLKDSIEPPYPLFVLLVEFDTSNARHGKKTVKKALKMLEQLTTLTQSADEPEEQLKLWKIRQASSVVLGHNEGQQHGVPVIDDGVVPVDRIEEYIEGVYRMFRKAGVKPAFWGHAADGIFHMQPKLDIGQVGDRQKAFRLLDEYEKLIIGLNGAISSESGVGRLRAPYLASQYNPDVYELLQKVKKIFDPHNTLNPGVIFGTSLDDLKAITSSSYSLEHFYDHLPRS